MFILVYVHRSLITVLLFFLLIWETDNTASKPVFKYCFELRLKLACSDTDIDKIIEICMYYAELLYFPVSEKQRVLKSDCVGAQAVFHATSQFSHDDGQNILDDKSIYVVKFLDITDSTGFT